MTDGIDTDSGQVDITILPFNDAPVVDLNGGAAGEDYADTFTEGGAPVGIAAPTVAVTDQDDTTLPLLKLDFDESTIVDAGAEFLTIGGTDFQLDAAADSTTAVMVGGVSYDVTFTAATASFEIVRSNGAEMTIAQSPKRSCKTPLIETILLCRPLAIVFWMFALMMAMSTATLPPLQSQLFATPRQPRGRSPVPATVIDGNNATFVVELSDPLRDGETASVDLGLDEHRHQRG